MYNDIDKYKMSLSGKIVAVVIVVFWAVLMFYAATNKPEPEPIVDEIKEITEEARENLISYLEPLKKPDVHTEKLPDVEAYYVISEKQASKVANAFNDMKYDLSDSFIPRIDIPILPKDLKNLPIPEKKDLFIKIVLPLVLRENENIRYDRYLLLTNINRDSDTSRLVMNYLQEKYRLKKQNDEELLERIMPIPVSLALAQAAIESGWGTSHFAKNGNALFGQHAYKGQKALKSRDGRNGSAKYGVAAFDSLSISVSKYMLNLNTHRAYRKFRQQRQHLSISAGVTLSNHLLSYSERGTAYIKDIKRMIKRNNLTRFESKTLK